MTERFHDRTERRLDRLREAYGEVGLHEETFEATREKYEAVRRDAERDALGGARVVIEADGALALVKNRGEGGVWDVPGGAREAGERLEATARREVREELGLEVDLGTAVWANRFGFDPGDGDPVVVGLWVYFEGTTERQPLDVQEAELRDAGWFESVPGDLDVHAERALSASGWSP